MTYLEIISKVADELSLPKDIVDKTYKGYWIFIRTIIQNVPLKSIQESEFDDLKLNFNIPSLGKLSCTKDDWIKQRRKYEYIKEMRRSKHAKNNKS